MSVTVDLDENLLPRHVAIIMDGNGRWAQRRRKPRLFGHKAGAESVRDIVEACREIGIEYLTLYAFSSENWKRPDQEVSGLMSILKKYLISELPKMVKNDVRLLAIGNHAKLPEDVRKTLRETIKTTAENNKLTLTLALSYGGRDEIVRAVKKISADCVNGSLQVDQICEDTLQNALDTSAVPDPDLLIRTGGEARLSNFLLWQASYAEILFTDMMWPDFRKDAFYRALSDYQKRERRFGRTREQLHSE
ncbi:isoprenyl transferase [Desulforhopalus singaporensis]|uniref:Isoprenyl transferase n=1 Tax=Desulforhopalus singaporensis TaxID=91360 RepID=A0A1H0RCV5_9BACT|nr:isoprenyl transferase [Desulforhopalus singaporensis]SDP27367.1 Undecaprenyl pyrophosphate synthetase [Desulforhopalus singaporensis]